ATTELSPPSLHDALPILRPVIEADGVNVLARPGDGGQKSHFFLPAPHLRAPKAVPVQLLQGVPGFVSSVQQFQHALRNTGREVCGCAASRLRHVEDGPSGTFRDAQTRPTMI